MADTKFEWDDRKRQSNLRKHGFDFVDAERVFAGTVFTIPDTVDSQDEDRFVSVGLLRDIAVVIVHTERDNVIRIISMRKATRYEETNYYKEVCD